MEAELPNDDEARAWAELLGRWDDEVAHRAFLDGFRDLDGLSRAGACYRGVLAARPGDPVALRWRDEIVRRASAAGLASLPRAAGVPRVPRWVRPAVLVLVAAVLAACAFLLLRTLATTWGRS